MNMAGNALAVYVHWPWCLAKCPYCDFNAHVWEEIPRAAYLDALSAQLRATRDLTGPRDLAAVFFGGGTPSLMGDAAVGRILSEIGQLWGIPAGTEITVECNPTSSSRALFEGLRAAGVNRVSIGVQSTRADWLEFLGRKHDAGQALATLDAAQEVIGNVNADLIFGLPEQHLPEWLEQLESLGQRGLPHMSCYQLTIEPQTRFWSDVKRGQWQPMPDDTQADFIAATRDALKGRGYRNYEISNFAQEGKRCRHNLHVWAYGDYAGVGAGAHGRLTLPDGRRVATQVTKHPRNYLANTETGVPVMKMADLSHKEQWKEAILSGLRLDEGIDVGHMETRLGGKLIQNVDEVGWRILRQAGFLDDSMKRLKLADSGWLVMDGVLSQLFAA